MSCSIDSLRKYRALGAESNLERALPLFPHQRRSFIDWIVGETCGRRTGSLVKKKNKRKEIKRRSWLTVTLLSAYAARICSLAGGAKK